MDPHQFAYQANRSVEDAINLAVHSTLQHLESSNTYARMLFIDFSSAFNTIDPLILFSRLQAMNIDIALCHWILDFLRNRTQTVKVNNATSCPLTLNTGAPQGCVLSPLLFSIYTNDLRSHHHSVKMLKYADDTTIIGLIRDEDESQYIKEVNWAVDWCRKNKLHLNASKTKEIVVDLRRRPNTKALVNIFDQPITLTESFTFLGSYISQNLKWDINTSHLIKKAQQRLYFLRQLKKFHVNKHLLVLFYKAIIESIITASISVWYGSSDSRTKMKLERVVTKASNIIGCDLPSVLSLYAERSLNRAKNIIRDSSHPSHDFFELLPSGRRYRSMRAGTTRLNNSFFPSAIRLLNSQS